MNNSGKIWIWVGVIAIIVILLFFIWPSSTTDDTNPSDVETPVDENESNIDTSMTYKTKVEKYSTLLIEKKNMIY